MSTLSNKKILIYGNIVTLVITVIVNFLAVLLPLNGRTTQELSDSYPNLFVPAGYVFSIWSVIYILLIIFASSTFTSHFENLIS
jgi:hypothetical protein